MGTTFAQAKQRVESEASWLLHSYAYRETSLILEIFSYRYGRIAMVARGARRPGSQLRGNIIGFQPLQLSWFGSGELKTLHSAEWQGGVPQLSGAALMCGFYLNELLLKLLPREDSYPHLFDQYRTTIATLALLPRDASSEIERVLRRFEMILLTELGFGVVLDRDTTGDPIVADAYYEYLREYGFRRLPTAVALEPHYFLGTTLLAIAKGEYQSVDVMQQAKLLMRQMLAPLLGDAPLYTRQLLRDLQRLQA